MLMELSAASCALPSSFLLVFRLPAFLTHYGVPCVFSAVQDPRQTVFKEHNSVVLRAESYQVCLMKSDCLAWEKQGVTAWLGTKEWVTALHGKK